MHRGDRKTGRCSPPGGYTLVAMLLVLALVALGLAAAGPAWAHYVRREREQELLHIGRLYAQALAHYRDVSPGSAKQFPRSLDALLLDARFIGVMRHLRRLYADPLDPRQPWGTVRDTEGGIRGVYSQSTAAPLAQGALVFDHLTLPPAGRYCEWQFIASPAP